MSWLKSRRLHYCLGVVTLLFLLFALLRLVFLAGFSGLGASALAAEDVRRTFGIGLRFDLRLAILLVLPLALLAWLPRWNMIGLRWLRWIGRVYVVVALTVVALIYIVDFGHYAYLGVRINATVFRFVEDASISAAMVWQTYPVVWITLGWLGAVAVVAALLVWLESFTLDRPATVVTGWSAAWGGGVVAIAALFGILGRVDNINVENPTPLRWSDAFFTGDNQIGALGLNPVIFLYDTLKFPAERYDKALVREYYPVVSRYLGTDQPDSTALRFDRIHAPQAHALPHRPNVIFVMLESLGSSAVGAYGNPLNPTPNLDRLATQSWFFRHFFVPVSGTAKTVWASITGIPDVSREETATRNPLITDQFTVLNAFEGYQKLYSIGGNSGWANMNALIRRSIDDVRLYDEADWHSPLVDVWGISDLDLFKESDRLLRALPRDRPFFAYIQTAGNHRPFTIPKQNDGFEVRKLPLEEVRRYGSLSLEQYNAVRLLDFNIGRLIEMAKAGGYYENTIFVFFGDHNTRITQLPHMPPAFEKLGLESNHVPLLIHAPGLIEPRVFEEAVGLADLLPTVAGLAGFEFSNRTLGRDILKPAPEGERVVPVVLREGTFPLIGAVSRNFLVQMGHDGSNPSMHALASATPLENIAAQHPEEYQRLAALARGLYESSRLMLYQNVRDRDAESR